MADKYNKSKFDLIAPLTDSERKNMTDWKIVIDKPFLNCDKIHPLQQRRVAFILSYLSLDDNIKSITIFGSSVTTKCHNDSDLDIYVELYMNQKIKMPICDFVFDLWTNYTVVPEMMIEIKSKGVIVYEYIK